MTKSLEQIHRNEENVVNSMEVSELQSRIENILPAVEEQHKEYLEKGESKIWQMQKDGIVKYEIKAGELLEEHGSSQIIQSLFENNEEFEVQGFDDARLIAFCRMRELDKGREN